MNNGNLISALRNMVDDIEKLGAAPLTVDVSVLRQAIVHLGMNEAALRTIKLQSDLMEAIGSEMRAAGCIFDPDACKVVNTLTPPEGWVLVPVEPTKGLLMSMALRSDHALGFPGYYDQEMLRALGGPTHQQQLDATISDARRHHEEVVGTGFYSPDKEASYIEMLAAHQKEPK